MGYTVAEKILNRHSRKKVKAGDVAICRIDFCFSQDGTSELVIDGLAALRKRKVFNRRKFRMVIDHSAPSPRVVISNIHQKMRRFSLGQKTLLFDVGEGTCHQVVPEAGLVLPGNLVVGADSHTCTYGALNAFACGLGSTDIAMVLATGKNWFRVPQTVKIDLKGELGKAVSAKDVALYIIGQLGANGCTYQAVEFSGPVIDRLSMDGRFTLSNMAVEMGAKCAIFYADDKTVGWLKQYTQKQICPVQADRDAGYNRHLEFDLSGLVPQIARPHRVDNVAEIKRVSGRKVDVAFLGTCTNGRLEDLKLAALVLKNRQVHRDVTFLVAPASKNIYLRAASLGLLETLSRAGGIILPPGCGPCVGTHAGIPAGGQTVISTANRNFRGRMGNSAADIFLASPLTVAASSLTGKITDPRKYI